MKAVEDILRTIKSRLPDVDLQPFHFPALQHGQYARLEQRTHVENSSGALEVTFNHWLLFPPP